MKQLKKVVHNVQCAFNPDHVFEKAFTIEDGSETEQSEVEAFCPLCEKFVTVTIQGKVVPDDEIRRKFNIERL